jgi:hypothetical protein
LVPFNLQNYLLASPLSRSGTSSQRP